MNVLEYVVKTFKKTSREIAEQIGVAPQTFNDWIKGRREIPHKRLNQLSELFSVDKALFLKDENDLTEIDKLNIYLAYLKEMNTYQYDPEINEFPHFTHEIQIRQTNILIENEMLLSDIRKLISGGGFFEDENYDRDAVINYYFLKNFVDVLMNKNNNAELLKELKGLLNIK